MYVDLAPNSDITTLGGQKGGNAREEDEGKQLKISKIEEAKNRRIIQKYRYKLQKKQMGDTNAWVDASRPDPTEREIE